MKKDILKQIIIDQSQEPSPTPLINRTKLDTITAFVDSPLVVIVSGIRRCGKSTVLQRIRDNVTHSDYYINFDDDRLATFKLDDFAQLYEVFVELYGEQNYFYFDEIQNIEGWERYVRRLHNEGRKVFITGSNASLLSAELGTRLTGRHITIELYPYSFSEYLLRQQPELLQVTNRNSTQIALIKKYFNEYIKVGGMPEFLENQQIQYLQTLYENILYRDVIVRHKLPQAKPIRELVYYLASNNAKEFSYNKLAKLLGLASSNTIAEYCSYLENSFLCFVINRFSYSLKKQIHYAKKIYFIDTALAASVGFRISEDRGRTLENIVFLELKRREHEIYFHKEKHECDFVIRDGYKIQQAIQVCISMSDEDTKKRELNGLIEALEAYDLNKGIIITEDETGEENIEVNGKNYKIEIVPCWQWLER